MSEAMGGTDICEHEWNRRKCPFCKVAELEAKLDKNQARDMETITALEAKLERQVSGAAKMLEQRDDRIAELEAKLERIMVEVRAAYNVAFDSPELNMSNYDEAQVAALNNAMIDICGALLAALEDKS